jgi:hypothetical protein
MFINSAEITVNNLYSLLETARVCIVSFNILADQVGKISLQFQYSYPDMLITVGQNKRNDSTAAADVQNPGVGTQLYEMGQQHGINGKPVTVPMLHTNQAAVKQGIFRVFLLRHAALFTVFKWTT